MGRHRNCLSCPTRGAKKAPPAPAAKAAPQEKRLDDNIVSVEGEGQRTWNWALYGTGTCVRLLMEYTKLGVPGNPLTNLYALRDLLNKVIAEHETKNEDRSPT